MAARDQARASLSQRTGLSDPAAEELLQKVLEAVQQEAIDLIAGDQPVPSALADARALRLRYISEAMGRSLNLREVESLFRVGSSAAATVISRMNATYPTVAEGLLKLNIAGLLGEMDEDGEPINYSTQGSPQEGWRYRIRFDEPVQTQLAAALFVRHGHARQIVKQTARVLEVQKDIAGGDAIELLEEWLQ